MASTWGCPQDKSAQAASGQYARTAIIQELMCHGQDAPLGLLLHLGCQHCYQTKLGSTCPHAVKPIYCYEVVVKESTAFIAGHQARSPGQLVVKRPWTPHGFQGKVFKDREREGSCEVCDQLVDSLLTGCWWSGVNILSLLVPRIWCLRATGPHTVNFFHLVEVSVSAK